MAFLHCAKPIRCQNPYRQRLGFDLLLRRVRKLRDRSPSACCSRGYESRCGLRIANASRSAEYSIRGRSSAIAGGGRRLGDICFRPASGPRTPWRAHRQPLLLARPNPRSGRLHGTWLFSDEDLANRVAKARSKERVAMKRCVLTMCLVSLVVSVALAQKKTAPPPPKPADKGPSLVDTMKFIQDKLTDQNKII
jgi:hypothetical protein